MLPLAALFCILLGCTHSHDVESGHAHDAAGGHVNDAAGGHAHDAQGNHITPAEPTLKPLPYTLYTDKTELFVEFKPLIVGQESRFAAHFTALGDLFKAIGEGSVTLSLVGASGEKQSITADKPEVPGIFRLRMTPEKVGIYNLVFDIKTPAYTDKITIEKVEVFADEKTAIGKQEPAKGGGSDITYLKAQAWKVEFANAPAVKVLLKSGTKPTLVIPSSALLEEKGVFYAYVQTQGESFQKRELKTGASDGKNVQVISGIAEGERVVTKGAYQIKLSAASGTLPAHGHEH